TGATAADLSIFWEALQRMWDLDRSASRGFMTIRGLYVFTHKDSIGNAPAHDLFDRIQVRRKDGVEAPRKFADYTVTVNDADLPEGVTVTRLVG
ncbi:MAG: type I CRISPR-associated protein Cas7, partial [Candidatus Methylomirabilales bacterium]